MAAVSSTPAPGDPGQPLMVTVTGRIVNVVCGEVPVLVVAADGATLRLRIDDPLAVRVHGRPEATTDLHCGAQSGPTMRIGYLPVLDAAGAITGNLRVLDYGAR